MIFDSILALSILSALIYGVAVPKATVSALLLTLFGSFLGLHLLFVLFVCAASLFCRRGVIEKQKPVASWCCMAVGQWLCGWMGVKLRLSGEEKLPKTPFLFVCNHRSMADPLSVMGRLPSWHISFISKPSNIRLPVAGPLAESAGFLAIDRENDREALKTILQAADYLKRGVCSMGIFPEGTRSKTKELLPFHAGSFKIAQRAGVPLVVASISGSEKLKKGLGCLTPKTVFLDIIEVIDPQTVKAMKTVELSDMAKELIEANLKRREGETA